MILKCRPGGGDIPGSFTKLENKVYHGYTYENNFGYLTVIQKYQVK
jgi:hypothetical protein